MLAIYLNPDHCHILLELSPDVSLSSLVKDIKVASNKFINSKGLSGDKFGWQEGFGAFTHSRSQVDQVVRYILNQPEHHKRFDFQGEFLKTLANSGVQFDPDHIFKD